MESANLVAKIIMSSLNKSQRENSLIIFVKYPRSGFVKTRLSASIGNKEAFILYKLFVDIIISRTRDSGFRRVVFFTPATRKREFIDWLGKNVEFYPQKGNDLGKRMLNAFKTLFREGARRVVVIGTDCPFIDRGTILKAFKELETKQCIVGPSLDGGYYLLGLSKLYKEIFRGIEWGTENVFSRTLDIIKTLKIRISFLERNLDVDDFDSLTLLRDRLQKVKSVDSKDFYTLKKTVDKVIVAGIRQKGEISETRSNL